MIKNLKYQLILISILFILFLLPRLILLGNDFINIDFPLWNDRITSFANNIKAGNFNGTYQTFHPGVTVMWLSGIGFEFFRQIYRHKFGGWPIYNDANIFPWWSFSLTFPLVLAIAVLTLFSFFLIKKTWSFKEAFLFVFLLSLEPYFLGYNRILHLDSLHAMFGFVSILSFMVFKKEKKIYWLSLSGMFAGLSFLTRTTGIFVLISLGFLVILSFLHDLKSVRNLKLAGLKLISFIKITIFILIPFLLVLWFVFPAAWLEPFNVYAKIFRGSFVLSSQGHDQVWFGKSIKDPPPVYYLISFLFSASPFFLILSFLSLIHILFLPKTQKEKFIPLLIYLACFIIMISLSPKKIPRYLITLFPVFSFFSSAFLSTFVTPKRKIYAIILIFGLLLFQVWGVVKYFPYFTAYASPLFGGMPAKEKIIGNKHFGFGLKNVAAYLNTKENIGSVKLIFEGYGSIEPFILGNVKPDKYFWLNGVNSVDYYLKPYYIYVDNYIKKEDIWSQVKDKFVLDRIFKIGGFDYWYLYKNRRLAN